MDSCSLFAHADGLAFGSEIKTSNDLDDGSPSGSSDDKQHHFLAEAEHLEGMHGFPGNRPSTLLLCGKLDAFSCGQLVAMAEHRAAVKAWIWGIDPFPSDSGTVARTSPRMRRSIMLKESLDKMMSGGYFEEDDDGDDTENMTQLDLSTKTILWHYANIEKISAQIDTCSK